MKKISLTGILMAIFAVVSLHGADKPIYVLDFDPGTDDAVAFFLMVKNGIGPTACVSSYGNKPLVMTHRNLLLLKRWLKSDCQVFKGASGPLAGEPPTCGDFHGKDGLGNASQTLSEQGETRLPGTTGDLKHLAEFIMARRGITYISVGPLTNLAMLLTQEPRIVEHISRVLTMGGGLRRSNQPNASEYNFHADPTAVDIVMKSRLDITLFPLDATHAQRISTPKLNQLAETGAYPVVVAMANVNRNSNNMYETDDEGAIFHDALTVAYILEPAKFTLEDVRLAWNKWGHVELSATGRKVHLVAKVETDTVFKLLKKQFELAAR